MYKLHQISVTCFVKSQSFFVKNNCKILLRFRKLMLFKP